MVIIKMLNNSVPLPIPNIIIHKIKAVHKAKIPKPFVIVGFRF